MALGTVIINGQRYTADCTGGATDPRWGGRRVRDIRMEESYETMQQLFPAGGMVEWATVNPHVELRLRVDEHGEPILDESGKLCLDRAGLAAFAHGEYFALGEVIGKFGFSAAKKKKPHPKGGKTGRAQK